MNTTDAIIIGEGILGLYAGIKAAEKGYNVKIFEKKSKPIFINNFRMIFSESNHSIKKFFNRLDITTEQVENKITIVQMIISKLERMPTSLQQDTKFSQTCSNSLSKNNINILKKELYDYSMLMSIDTYSAIQLIKKNYLYSKTNFVVSECTSKVLKKMREYFKSLNGQIFYNYNIQSIGITSTDQFLCNINGKCWCANIIISTIGSENLLKIFNWSSDTISYIKSNTSYINTRVDTNLLELCKISIPCRYKTYERSFNIQDIKPINFKNVFGINAHFYICHDDYNRNPNWLSGTIDSIHDIMKNI